MTGEIILLLLLASGVGIVMIGVQFFFNPLGLGPEPATVLPDRFFHHPAQSLSELELLIDGAEAFDRILNRIDTAQDTVMVQTFIWKDDDIGRKMAATLIAAACRGVKVTIQKDVVGTFFELGDILKGRASPVYADKRLRGHANINVSTDIFRATDHAKYFIIDNRRALLGGMNIACEYHKLWHDYMVEIDSAQWTTAFEKKTVQSLDWPDEAPPFILAVNNRNVCEIRTAILQVIDNAKRSVVLEHAYFSDDKVIDAIVRASGRGVLVRVVLPKNPGTHLYANMATVNKLLSRCHKDKCGIYFYPRMTHAKVGVVDGTIAIVGSANLTNRSMRRSYELMLFVNGKKEEPFIKRLRERLDADIEEAEKVTAPFNLSMAQRLAAFAGKYTW